MSSSPTPSPPFPAPSGGPGPGPGQCSQPRNDNEMKNDNGEEAKIEIGAIRSADGTVTTFKIVHEEEKKVPKSKSKRTRKDRCARCRKKIPLVWQHPCKCDQYYCAQHRFGVSGERFADDSIDGHACTFNYHEEAEKRLVESLPKVVSNKGLNPL